MSSYKNTYNYCFESFVHKKAYSIAFSIATSMRSDQNTISAAYLLKLFLFLGSVK